MTQRDESDSRALIERELTVENEDGELESWGAVRVCRDGRLVILRGELVLYSATLEHFAWSMIFWQPGLTPDEQLPPPGQKVVKTVYADGRREYALVDES